MKLNCYRCKKLYEFDKLFKYRIEDLGHRRLGLRGVTGHVFLCSKCNSIIQEKSWIDAK